MLVSMLTVIHPQSRLMMSDMDQGFSDPLHGGYSVSFTGGDDRRDHRCDG
jgi:hypothetical protein